MVATHVKKIKHGMLCITGVYLRDITYTIFIVLHLSMSCLSICSFCFFSSILVGTFNTGIQVLSLKDGASLSRLSCF